MYQTDMYEGMLAETVTLPGAGGELINAYFARPLGAGPWPGIVVIHHMPGWDEWYRDATRKFAHHGYAAIAPNPMAETCRPVRPRVRYCIDGSCWFVMAVRIHLLYTAFT